MVYGRKARSNLLDQGVSGTAWTEDDAAVHGKGLRKEEVVRNGKKVAMDFVRLLKTIRWEDLSGFGEMEWKSVGGNGWMMISSWSL